MATKITSQWIDGVWSAFNNIISKFSNIKTELPERSNKILASDIASLNSKIQEIKDDYYLSTESSLFSTYSVKQGDKITQTFKNKIDEDISNFSVLKCKNEAAYELGTKTVECTSNGTKGNGNSRTLKTYGSTPESHNGHSSYGTTKTGKGSCTNTGYGSQCANEVDRDLTCPNQPCPQGTKQNGLKTNGKIPDLRNSNTIYKG